MASTKVGHPHHLTVLLRRAVSWLRSTALHCTVLHRTALYRTVMSCTALQRNALHYTEHLELKKASHLSEDDTFLLMAPIREGCGWQWLMWKCRLLYRACEILLIFQQDIASDFKSSEDKCAEEWEPLQSYWPYCPCQEQGNLQTVNILLELRT